MFCIHCGHELDSNNICHNNSCPSIINSNSHNEYKFYNNNFNPKFGYRYDPNFVDINGITSCDMIQFLGDKNTSFYIDKWTSNQSNPNFLSWNWPAFLFTWIWLFYRKMNLLGSIYSVVYFTVFLTTLFFLPFRFFCFLIFIGKISCGLLGNQLYIKHCTKKIKSTKYLAQTMNLNNYNGRLNYRGGVTVIPIVVGIILYLLIGIISLVHFIFDDIDKYNYPNSYYEDDYDSDFNPFDPYYFDPYSDYDDPYSDYDDSEYDDSNINDKSPVGSTI